MHENITKVQERGERLDALQDKTGEWTRRIGVFPIQLFQNWVERALSRVRREGLGI